jgi:hypothetical protein
MAPPITTPLQDQILAIVEEVARLKKENEELKEKVVMLQAIIDLYINPLEELFSDDDGVRFNAFTAVAKKRDKNRERLDSIEDIKADIQDLAAKCDVLSHVRKPGKVLEARLKKTDELLIARNNAPIPYSEMKCLQGFKCVDKKHDFRRQDMTKLGHVYEQYPDKYEVRESKMGGKTIKLTHSYFKHLTNGGV